MGDILSGKFQKTLLGASIAFDQSNGLSPPISNRKRE